ncbi:hypothetical protein MCOR25_002159 [Pyricularia grisea]|nr:hypothetical protein MCOR25_002159 [Pyricularia grisea]
MRRPEDQARLVPQQSVQQASDVSRLVLYGVQRDHSCIGTVAPAAMSPDRVSLSLIYSEIFPTARYPTDIEFSSITNRAYRSKPPGRILAI